MLALRAPEIHVELLTTVAGNVPVDVATANALPSGGVTQPLVLACVARGVARPLRRPLYTATAIHGHDGLGGLTQLRQADGVCTSRRNVRQPSGRQCSACSRS